MVKIRFLSLNLLVKVVIALALLVAAHTIFHFRDYTQQLDSLTLKPIFSDQERQGSRWGSESSSTGLKTSEGADASINNLRKLDLELDFEKQPDKRLDILFASEFYHENSFTVTNFDLEDKRLLPLYWLYLLNHQEDTVEALPFNWNLLTDFPTLIKDNPHFAKVVHQRYNCAKFGKIDKALRKKIDLPHNFKQFDEEYCRDDEPNEYGLPFAIVKKLDGYFHDYHYRTLYNMLYSLVSFPVPQNAMFLNIFPLELGKSGKNYAHRSLMHPLKKVEMGYDNDFDKLQTYFTNISQHIIEMESLRNESRDIRDILAKGVSLVEQVEQLSRDFDQNTSQYPYVALPEAQIYRPTVVGGLQQAPEDFQKPLLLDRSLFDWYLPDIVEKTPKESHLYPYLERNLDLLYDQERYYGVSHVKNMKLDHYDWRFFKEETFRTANDVHILVIHRLLRTWFQLCQTFGVATWINHGPLIGWYWDGLVMPFDSDLDTTIPIQSLHQLLKFLNDTLVYDFTDWQNGRYRNEELKVDTWLELGLRSFYFEVNNNYPHRNRYQSGKNNIDARLIDTETGIYIDITLISSFVQLNNYDLVYERAVLKSMNSAERERFYKGADFTKFYDNIYTRLEVPSGDVGHYLYDYSMEVIYEYDQYLLRNGEDDAGEVVTPSMLHFKDVLNDRNYHLFRLEDDAYHLLPVYFENSPMYIPRNFMEKIVSEYSTNLITNNYHNNYRFFSDLRLWVNYDACPYYNERSGEFNDESDTELGILQRCLESNSQVFRNFNLLLDYTKHATELRDLLVDLRSIGNPQFDEAQLLAVLSRFNSTKILRPEVWSRNNLFNNQLEVELELDLNES